MTTLRAAAHQTFSSLRVRNYRLYFTAQLISVSGTWMQSVAQAWLVLHLTGSGVDLGIVVGLQFLPDAPLRPLRRSGGRPGRQAPAALRHPVRRAACSRWCSASWW